MQIREIVNERVKKSDSAVIFFGIPSLPLLFYLLSLVWLVMT